jgi:hypothetical protein
VEQFDFLMTMTVSGSHSGNQVSTYQKNSAKIDYPVGFAFMSKGELRKAYTALLIDAEKTKREYISLLQKKLLMERELYQNQVEINRQKKEIIELYDKLNSENTHVALMVAG